MSLTKVNQNLVNTIILNTFHNGAKIDRDISDAVNRLGITYKCPDCGKYHPYIIKPTTVIWKLNKLGLIDKEHFDTWLIVRAKAIRRNRSRESYRAKKNIGVDNVCCKCGSRENIEAHHIIPVWEGGSSEKENLQAICHNCHMKLHGLVKNTVPWEIRKFGINIGSRMISDLKSWELQKFGLSPGSRIITDLKNRGTRVFDNSWNDPYDD